MERDPDDTARNPMGHGDRMRHVSLRFDQQLYDTRIVVDCDLHVASDGRAGDISKYVRHDVFGVSDEEYSVLYGVSRAGAVGDDEWRARRGGA
mmetsp:Transcript_59654/g.89965  ORF Transcript_59654/g.89965 Transcript_59654/m.89965 type:complete len:93 (+) Transcript_59654:385-663(+)